MGGSDPSSVKVSQADFGDSGPLLPGDKGVLGGLSGVRGALPASEPALVGNPGCSGTVGVLTGIIGGFMGMGPRLRPPEGRRRLGFEDGVRRMVATPGVMAAEGLEGRPVVDAGRLDWNIRRYD